MYKSLNTFDERIASIQEIVVLEANEMADGAIKKFATTAAAAAATGSGGKPKDHDGIDVDFLPLLDESSSTQTAASNRRRGVALGADGKAGVAAHVDPEELVSIDSDVYVKKRTCWVLVGVDCCPSTCVFITRFPITS